MRVSDGMGCFLEARRDGAYVELSARVGLPSLLIQYALMFGLIVAWRWRRRKGKCDKRG